MKRLCCLALCLTLWLPVGNDAMALAMPEAKGYKLTLSQTEFTMQKDALYQLAAEIEPFARRKVSWSSYNTKIATVDSAGVVRGKKAGWTTITAKISGGAAARCKVTVADSVESPEDWFTYRISGGGAVVIKYRGPELAGTAVVPRTLGGQPVTEIGQSAFFNAVLLKVMLPDSVQEIADSAFDSCTMSEITMSTGLTRIGARAFSRAAIQSIIIPKGVTRIEDETFWGCEMLRSMSIQGQITHIGAQALSYCAFVKVGVGARVRSIADDAFGHLPYLREINVSADNPNYSSRGGVLFNKDQTRLLVYPQRRVISNYPVHKTATSVAPDAFAGCQYIRSTAFDKRLTSLGEGAFMWCRKLESVKFSTGLTKIEPNVFYGCTKLKKVMLPEGITEICSGAFMDGSKSRKLYLPRSLAKIGNTAGHGERMAFDQDAVLYVYQGSYAMQYAASNGYKYVLR